jgi:hypothetical protein
MKTARLAHHVRSWIVVATLVLVFAGNGISGQKTAIPAADDRAVAHVLNRLTFGPRQGDAARVKSMGIARSSIDNFVPSESTIANSRPGWRRSKH